MYSGNLDNIVKNCGKCALCLAVCPVYKVERNEINSPRAKVQLTKTYLNKELKSSRYLEKIFSMCLLCEGCKSMCPGGVKSDELFLSMRNEFIKKYGLKFNGKIASKIFSNKKLFSSLINFIRLSKGQSLVEKMSFINLKIGTVNIKNIPELSGRTLKSQFPELIKSKTDRKGAVLYFTGCIDNFFYDSVGKATINILTKLGYDVILSKEEMCCAVPMLISGDFEGSLNNIKNNLKILAIGEVDAIIVTCATCGTALKKLYIDVLQKLKLEKELGLATEISKKVKDINEFLIDKLDLKKKSIYQGKRITYHDPCHLVYAQNIKEEPRSILKNIQGIEYVEIGEPTCCGSAGFFHVNFPEISEKIGSEKLNNIINTKADIVVTSCPSCKIQLINLINNAKLNTKVLHIVEVIENR